MLLTPSTMSITTMIAAATQVFQNRAIGCPMVNVSGIVVQTNHEVQHKRGNCSRALFAQALQKPTRVQVEGGIGAPGYWDIFRRLVHGMQMSTSVFLTYCLRRGGC